LPWFSPIGFLCSASAISFASESFSCLGANFGASETKGFSGLVIASVLVGFLLAIGASVGFLLAVGAFVAIFLAVGASTGLSS
jgi:hypothetical protein